MIISCTFSKPSKNVEEILGRPYLRIKIRAANNSNSTAYFVEAFTEKQAFHEQKTEEELSNFIQQHAGTTFKNCVVRTESQEITYLGNKKGNVTRLEKPLKTEGTPSETDSNSPAKHSNSGKSSALRAIASGPNKKKNYLIPEGNPVPFMVLLGVMTPEGRVVNSRYDKFRQINRFLEFINDVLPEVQKQVGERPIRIADFGCGKSYLTFAVHYFLTAVKGIQAEIIGLDLKKDVIDYCNKIAGQLNLTGLKFDTGNIADYSYQNDPDIVITLHACDTATDFALDYAVKHNCKAILSVPCCQHEINQQLNKNQVPEEFKPLLKYGIIKERFSALLTDALRSEYLEEQGYSVQMLEFIDMEHTPKNILIRAVLKANSTASTGKAQSSTPAEALTSALKISPTLKSLLK